MTHQILKAFGVAVFIIAIVPFMMILAALFGYFGGWLFGAIFPQTWAAFHLWWSMPDVLTPGMFGAFMSSFGAAIGKTAYTGKKD